MSKTEVYAIFLIMSDRLKGKEIEHVIGLKADEVWNKGDIIDNRSTLKQKYNGWQREIKLGEEDDFEEIIYRFLLELRFSSEKINKFSKNDIVRLYIPVYYRDYRPAIVFSKESLDILSELGAELDIDIL